MSIYIVIREYNYIWEVSWWEIDKWGCADSFCVAVIKQCAERQLEEELILACSSRGYSFIMAQEHCKNWQLWWQKQEAKNACLPPQASSREWAGSGADNKRLPHDMLSPKRHYFTKVPKQCCQMGTKPSNTGAYKGHFSFKPQPWHMWNYAWDKGISSQDALLHAQVLYLPTGRWPGDLFWGMFWGRDWAEGGHMACHEFSQAQSAVNMDF